MREANETVCKSLGFSPVESSCPQLTSGSPEFDAACMEAAHFLLSTDVWADSNTKEERCYSQFDLTQGGHGQDHNPAHQARTARLFKSTVGGGREESDVAWLLNEGRPVRAVVKKALSLSKKAWLQKTGNDTRHAPAPGQFVLCSRVEPAHTRTARFQLTATSNYTNGTPGSRGLENIHSINILLQHWLTIGGSSFRLHQDDHALDGADPQLLSYTHIIPLFVSCNQEPGGDATAVEDAIRRAFSHNLWLNGKEIGEVDCSSWPSSEEWPNGGFGRPTGLGVAGYNSYSEFSKHGLICTFPSCVFHESRLPEGRFIAIKLVIFEKA